MSSNDENDYQGDGDAKADDLDVADFNDLFNKCESERQMHRLAEKYYGWRNYYFFTLPLAFLTMAAGIMAFLSSSSVLTDTNRQLFAIVVGGMSLLSIFWQTLAGKMKFDVKAEMHLAAAIDLKRVADDLDFQKVEMEARAKKKKEEKAMGLDFMRRRSASTIERETDAEKGAEEKEERNIEYYRAQYHQVMAGCKSVAPLCVSQAFAIMDTKLALKLTRKARETLEKDMGEDAERIMFAALCNEIYVGITSSRGWPLLVKNPSKVVDKALENLSKSYNPSIDYFHQEAEPMQLLKVRQQQQQRPQQQQRRQQQQTVYNGAGSGAF